VIIGGAEGGEHNTDKEKDIRSHFGLVRKMF
jgi:hypothetical protein